MKKAILMSMAALFLTVPGLAQDTPAIACESEILSASVAKLLSLNLVKTGLKIHLESITPSSEGKGTYYVGLSSGINLNEDVARYDIYSVEMESGDTCKVKSAELTL